MDWTKEVNLSRKPVVVAADGSWWVDITGPECGGDPVRNHLAMVAAYRGLKVLQVNWFSRKVQVRPF
jgi:hypothetical protein